MQDLTKRMGFPVAFEEGDNKLAPLEADVSFEESNRKYAKGMFGLLADDGYHKEDEPYYDFYKAIGKDGDRSKFTERGLRFDSTVIMEGAANGEFKKTAGHFHQLIVGQPHSYPELYQVIKGTAVFVMQKVTDPFQDGKMVVEDCILAEVSAGETVVIPPDYGHCTVNVSDETMVFVNLVAEKSTNDYAGVKASHGMCCYLWRNEDGSYRWEKNPRYEMQGTPRIVTPVDSEKLGLQKDLPAYTAYLRNPAGFDYLTNPEGYVDAMMQVLRDK